MPTPDTDAALADDARFDDALKRVSHEAGMLLGLEAVRAEQAYHRRRHTRHAYWLHGSGTVAGLRVSLRADDPAGDADRDMEVRIVVSPGIAIDGLGREANVDQPYGIDLRAWLTARRSEPERWAALIRDAHDPVDNTLRLDVTLRYRDVASGLQPVMADAVNAGTDPVQPARLTDAVLLELVPAGRADARGPDNQFAAHRQVPAWDAVAGLFSDAERQSVTDATGAERRRRELGARLLHALADDNQALATRRATTTGADELARTLLASLVIQLSPPDAAADNAPGLVINPLRMALDNLARPFVFSATALAHLLGD